MMNTFDRLKQSLTKSRDNLIFKIKEVLIGKNSEKELKIEELEEILLSSDLGANLTEKIVKNLRQISVTNSEELINLIRNKLKTILSIGKEKLSTGSISNTKPIVIVFIGVNGTGKTTTIGKLANYFRNLGKKVLLIPADTFRAASVEQLQSLSHRAQVELFSDSNSKDPGAVIYQGLNYAKKGYFNIIFVDTAGRLQNKTNLMAELAKINSVIKKFFNEFDIQHYLVIDANSGQNGFSQAVEFNKSMELDGLILSKLDGTSKGGIVFRIVEELSIPIKYIGTGEGIEDIEEFDLDKFVNSFFSTEK